ncbi:unnamed protein product [Brassica napus]|uniref:(rape) hypothetical protein n=1 Tax=Brassica napus TaxID=3708 RepID=A0A816JTB2_BRANA|nr:unnamed protein product [Brassica napus]
MVDLMGFRDGFMDVILYSEQHNYDKKRGRYSESYSGLVFKVPDITLHMIYMASYIGPGPVNFFVIAKPQNPEGMINPGLLAESVSQPSKGLGQPSSGTPWITLSSFFHSISSALVERILVIRLQSGPILMMMTRKGLPYWVTGRGLPESTFFPEGIKPLDVSE